jgi:hypothetical protein
MAVVFDDNKIRINLSNTESIGSSIYNYSDLSKSKESSVSSTSSYFLSTNLELSKKVLDYLNCDNSIFVVDINKTKQYINELDSILKNYDKNDFHGELKDYYNYREYYLSNNSNFELGFAKANIEEGPSGRSYLRFNNDDERVKLFRGIVVAIFSSIVIEKKDGKNYIFPTIKREIINMKHEQIKDEFRNYMLNVKKLNENSVVQYLDVIDYTSDDAINDGILDKSIYEYYDADEVKNILETLRQNDRFNTITFKRNHINTAAVGNYINFLEYKNSNNGATPIIIDETPSSFESSNLEDKVTQLILKLKNTTDNKEKVAITKDIIRNCYEMMNYYK